MSECQIKQTLGYCPEETEAEMTLPECEECFCLKNKEDGRILP